MQIRRSVLLALMIVLFIYFEIHSCSEDGLMNPGNGSIDDQDLICDAGDVFFINEETGWVAGSHGTMMRTVDGGSTWKAVMIEDVRLNDICFIDDARGWVVGKEGTIYESEDGGVTWERVVFSGIPNDDDLYNVYFTNESHGFVQGYHGVFRTEDGGLTWENHWLPIVPYRGAWSVSFVTGAIGYLLGSRWSEPDPVLIYKTEDGGLTWNGVEGSEASVLKSVLTVRFVDVNTGWAGGTVVMKTVDGGRTWSKQLEDTTIREFFFFDEEVGLAVGGLKILRTVNGGGEWIDVAPADERIVDLRSVFFLDENHGWIVGRGVEERIGGKIYRHSILMGTTNGGDTWMVRDFSFDYTEYHALEAPYGEE